MHIDQYFITIFDQLLIYFSEPLEVFLLFQRAKTLFKLVLLLIQSLTRSVKYFQLDISDPLSGTVKKLTYWGLWI